MSSLAYSWTVDARSQLRVKWDACHTWRSYTFNAMILTVTGWALLYFIVEHLGFNKYVAGLAAAPVIMFVVSYFVHRRRSFRKRKFVSEKCRQRYAAVRFGGMAVSKVSFVMLVGAGCPYLVVSICVTLVLAGPTYILNRDWAFAEEEPVDETEEGVSSGQSSGLTPPQ